MNIERIRNARKRMGKARLVRSKNEPRRLRIEAMRVLDTRGATRVSSPSKWVQSYVALHAGQKPKVNKVRT
jgi:hypothetical protein